MKKLENKVTVITGGTSGIGLATAKLFAAEGAKVIVTGSNPDTVATAGNELKGIAQVVRSDAGSSKDIQHLAQEVKANHGGIDVLFLNAGTGKFAPIVDFDEAAIDDSWRINFKGPWLAIKYFAPIFRRGGSIVLNTSISNQSGMPGASIYGATKAALRSLARTAAAELAEAGVRVNAVSPGPVDTPIYGKLGLSQEQIQGFSQVLMAQTVMKRFAKPEEIAKAVLFLASDDASYMTGEEVVVDGGLTRV